MPSSKLPVVPPRPERQWPVGARLRFRVDADIKSEYSFLRGTPVVIMSELMLMGPSEPGPQYSWRQQVLTFPAGVRVGWARPEQLELPPENDSPEPDYAAHRRRMSARRAGS